MNIKQRIRYQSWFWTRSVRFQTWNPEANTAVATLDIQFQFRKPHSFLWMCKPNISTEVAPFPANFLPFCLLWTEERNMGQTQIRHSNVDV